MGKSEAGNNEANEPMNDAELKKLLHLVANELNARLERGGFVACKKPDQVSVEDAVQSGMDVELCNALFAASAATQAAIIANGCAGA